MGLGSIFEPIFNLLSMLMLLIIKIFLGTPSAMNPNQTMAAEFPDLKKMTLALDAYNAMLKNPDGGMGASEVDIKEEGQVR